MRWETLTTVQQTAGGPTTVPLAAAAAAVLGLIAIAMLLASRRAVAGTTLTAPWGWSLLSLAAVSGVEVFLAVNPIAREPFWTDSLRFAASATTFCPGMALLGAKRPQDRAWQLIVVSLWVVLVLPAAEALVRSPGDSLQVRDARALFLWLLVAVGLMNFLATRFWPSALLLAAGQTCLFSAYLPLIPTQLGAAGTLAGLACFVSAVAMVIAGLPRRSAAACHEDRLWLDFRDAFGALWALRVAQRVDAAASMYGWNVTVRWTGLTGNRGDISAAKLPADIRPALHTTLRNLLRRFVSPDWIDSRLCPTASGQDAQRAVVDANISEKQR